MEKEFIPYEQALALKELRFDEPCLLRIQYSSGYDVFTGRKFQNSIWLGNGYDAEIDDKKMKYKFSKHSKDEYDHLKIPIYQQVFRWFREKYDLHPSIESYNQDENGNDIEYTYTYCVVTNKNLPKEWNKFYNTYEEAELECLKKLIEIVKEK